MNKKAGAFLATSFKNVQSIMLPQVWTAHVFTPEGVYGVYVTVQREKFTVKKWAEEFAYLLYSLNKQKPQIKVIGGLMLSTNEKDFVITSFYEDRDIDVFRMSEKIAGPLKVEF